MYRIVTLAVLLVYLFGCSTILVYASSRIVGGYDATLGQFPYQISLRMNHMHICGGSIISNNFILTAAHCVVEEGTKPYNAKNFTIRAGTHNRIAGGVIIQVARIIVHEEYGLYRNDLALLELEESLVYSFNIQPIELFEDEVPSGEEVIISGWGLLRTNDDNSPIVLQWNIVKALNKTECASKIIIYSDSIICLDHPKGAGACYGDSGGPAVNQGRLVGVAGFVAFSCGSQNPDGYAKVSYNIEWIRKIVFENDHLN